MLGINNMRAVFGSLLETVSRVVKSSIVITAQALSDDLDGNIPQWQKYVTDKAMDVALVKEGLLANTAIGKLNAKVKEAKAVKETFNNILHAFGLKATTEYPDVNKVMGSKDGV